jgi:hypothetical protein
MNIIHENGGGNEETFLKFIQINGGKMEKFQLSERIKLTTEKLGGDVWIVISSLKVFYDDVYCDKVRFIEGTSFSCRMSSFNC